MPRMAFIGVRISWLMLATNSDLRREASSARSRARRISSTAARSAVMSSMIQTVPCSRSWMSIALPVRRAQKRLPSRRINSCSRRWAAPRQMAA